MNRTAKVGLYKKNERLAKYAEKAGWLGHYENILKTFTYINRRGKLSRLTWQQAAYIAWSAIPKGHRLPKTKHEMAEELKLKTRVTMWKWEQQQWYKEMVTKTQDEFFLSHLNTIRHRTIEAAATESGVAGVASRDQYYSIVDKIIGGRELDEDIKELVEQLVKQRMGEVDE
jgi:hypothetical protein